MAQSIALVACLSVAGAFSGFSAGLTGFGRATLFHVLAMIATAAVGAIEGTGANEGGLVDTVTIVCISGALGMTPAAVAARKAFNAPLALLLAVPAVITTVVFTSVLVSTSEATLRLALGCGLFLFAVWRWYWTIHHTPAAAAAARSAARGAGAGATTVTATAARRNSLARRTARAAAYAAPPIPTSAKSAGVHRSTVIHIGPAGATVVPPSTQVLDMETGRLRSVVGRLMLRLRTKAKAAHDWSADQLPRTSVSLGALLTGALSGACQGVAGVAGPPVMVFVSLAGLDKSEVRATFLALGALSNAVQAVQLGLAGTIHLDAWPLYLGPVLGVLAGLAAGSMFHGRLTQTGARRCILVLLSLSAVALMGRGEVTDTLWAAVVLGVLVFLLWVGKNSKVRRRHGRSKRRAGRFGRRYRKRVAVAPAPAAATGSVMAPAAALKPKVKPKVKPPRAPTSSASASRDVGAGFVDSPRVPPVVTAAPDMQHRHSAASVFSMAVASDTPAARRNSLLTSEVGGGATAPAT